MQCSFKLPHKLLTVNRASLMSLT